MFLVLIGNTTSFLRRKSVGPKKFGYVRYGTTAQNKLLQFSVFSLHFVT